MTNPESFDGIGELIATDPRVVGYLHRVILMGPSEFNLESEFELASTLAEEYGVDIETFSDACAVAIDRIDQSILNGEISLL
jgi:hypothetical protein